MSFNVQAERLTPAGRLGRGADDGSGRVAAQVPRRRQSAREGSGVTLLRRLVRLDLRKKASVASKTLFGPIAPPVVVLWDGGRAFREYYPGLPGGREDMNIWRQKVRVVQRAHSYEVDQGSGAGIVAPDRNPARGTSGDELSAATCGRRVDELWRLAKLSDAICLDQGIEREGSSGLSLAPAAVAAVDKERGRFHSVPNRPAVTTALGWERIRAWHGHGDPRVTSNE